MKSTIVSIVSAVALIATTGVVLADESLAKTSSCMNCHQVAKKVVGPAFQDVAKKYKGDTKAVDHLAIVIKNGGKGVFGVIPMPPQPKVSEADAKKLAKWILAL
jgi:cytochrome c